MLSPGHRTKLAVAAILAQELCERLAYYSISTNLVERLLALGMPPAAAAAQTTAWSATAYLVAIVGAYLADALFGRYAVILGGMVLYVSGLAALVGVTAANASAGATLASLYVVALGTGGIKASVAPFGAAQLDATSAPVPQTGPGSRMGAVNAAAAATAAAADASTPAGSRAARDAAVATYFNFFYLSINIGALIASLAIVNVETSVSWAAGYAVALGACAAALAVFVAATPLYVRQPPTRARGGADPVAALGRVAAAAWRGRRAPVPPPEAELTEHPDLLAGSAADGRPRARRTRFLSFLDAAADPSVQPASSRVGVTDVEDGKRCVSYLTLSSCSIVFWLCYNQMQSALLLVGDQLDRTLPNSRIVLSSGTLSTFNTLAIVVLLPIYDFATTLATRRAARKPRRDRRRRCRPLPRVIGRVLGGHVITVVAMLSAVPPARAAAAAVAAGTPVSARPSVFTLSAPFILVGAAEVGASVGMLELAFTDAPHGARSLLQAVQLVTVAAGGYLASAFTAIVDTASKRYGGGVSWIPAAGQPGRLDLYFLTLAGVAAVNAAAFAGLAVWYRPRRLADDDDDESDDDGLQLSRVE